MTDLSVEENRAMEEAAYRRNRDEASGAAGLVSDRFEAGWFAAREYSKQREEKLREALIGVSNAYGCFVGCTGALPGAPADGSGHTPACRKARAALAENGDSDAD